MGKQILGTFQSHEAADAVKDTFIREGFEESALIVMVNRVSSMPPEDARLEVGTEVMDIADLGRQVTKTVRRVLHQGTSIDGDGSEGEGKGGALLAVRLKDDADETRVRTLLASHRASDIEVAEAD